MSKTNKKYSKFLGYKFFKDDKFIRLIKIFDFNDKVMIKDLDKGINLVINIEELKGYTPLEPYGIVTFNNVYYKSHNDDRKEILHDVIVTGYRLFDLKANIYEPFVICRQGVTDFFYTIIANKVNDWVGVSVTRENCPTNIEYKLMAGCDGISNSEMVNFYIDDVVENITECINLKTYNDVLQDLYTKHVRAEKIPLLSNAKSHKGWCRDINTLLTENNFITDLDAMRNITAVDFKISDYVIKDDNGLDCLNQQALLFFDNTFKINAVVANAIEYAAQ